MTSFDKYHIHECDLQTNSDSCLPALPPQTSELKKIARKWRKLLMVSKTNSNTMHFFKSNAAIILERKRQIRTAGWYTIHPFSQFCVYQEFLLSTVWILAYFKDPLLIAFWYKFIRTFKAGIILDAIIELIIALNIPLFFLTGYYKLETKETVLIPSEIVKNYLKTYFLFDLNSSIPYCHIALLRNDLDCNSVVPTILSSLRLARLVRFKTMFQFFRRLTRSVRLGDTGHEIMCAVLMFCFFVHWTACTVYIIPCIYFQAYKELPNNSWIVLGEVEPSSNLSTHLIYIECVFCAMTHFYRAGTGMFHSQVDFEQGMFCFVMISGTLSLAYLVINTLNIFQSLNTSTTRYDEMLHQLDEYIRNKNLPLHLRKRLFLYYEKRFRKHFFKEQTVFLMLSDHLRYELFLHSCKDLIEKVALFQGLPKSAVGALIGCLKEEVFLPNDVIVKAGTKSEYIYFIAHGTAVLLTPEGKEVLYLEDGDHFGEVPMLIPKLKNMQIFNIVALETVEVYLLHQIDLKNYLEAQPVVLERLVAKAIEKIEMTRSVQLLTKEEEVKHKDILYQLRKGKILQNNYKRRS